MRVGLIVPGGVDRSGERRIIPVLLALIERLARVHEVEVFALHQEEAPAQWTLLGARIENIGRHGTRRRALAALHRAHRRAPFAVLHALWSSTPGALTVLAGRLLGVPTLVHVVGGELVALPQIGYGGCLSWRGRLRERWVLRHADRVAVPSRPLLAPLERLGVRGVRVPLGIDRNRWPVRAPRPRAPGAPARLVQVASLNRVKDQTTLLQALARLRDAGVPFHLDLVGEDVLGGEMQRLAAQLGLAAQVSFHGLLLQPAVRARVEAADLLVVSSRHEGAPAVVLEAALAGVQTVGTAVGHVAEWAPNAARAVPVADATALAAMLQEVLADEALRLRLAAAAQAQAAREDADYTAREVVALYEALAAASARRRQRRNT